MLKIFTVLIKFLKELIFDSKTELDFNHSDFNSRKFIIFFLLILSLLLNAFLLRQLYHLAIVNIDLSDRYNKSLTACISNKNSKLHH